MPHHMEVVLLVLLGALVLTVLLQAYPVLRPLPGRDSGVFLYMGWRILDGEVPYRDVWDHKPPAVFFINALGLLLDGGSPWGVWALQLLVVAGAVALGYLLIRHAFGPLAASLASLAWVAMLPALMLDGNFTEEYALPLQWLALYLLVAAERRGRYGWLGYVIGLAAAGAFLLRQNLVGVWLAIGLYLLLRAVHERQLGRPLRPLSMMLLGTASGLLPALAYLAYNRALPAFWDAAFVYNRVYSEVSLYGLYESVRMGLMLLPGLSAIAFAGWLVALYDLLYRRDGLGFRQPLLTVAVLGLPAELLLSGISGRVYEHYYMAWLPVLSVLAANLIWSIETYRLHLWNWQRRALPAIPGLWLYGLAVVLVALVVLSNARLLSVALGSRQWPAAWEQAHDALEAVQQMTDNGDTVLMWGAETRVNFAIGRRSPARFTYQYPLYTPGYQHAGMVAEFLAAIRANKPVLIIDTSSTNRMVPPLDAAARIERLQGEHDFVLLPEMEQVFSYVAAHYRPVEMPSELGWVAYRYAGGS